MQIINITSDRIDNKLFCRIDNFITAQVQMNPTVPACDNMLWEPNTGLLDNIKNKSDER